MTNYTLKVSGIPVAKGSARAFVNRKTGRAIVTQTNLEKQKPWASAISYAAQQAAMTPRHGAVHISCFFGFPRPKAHFKGKAMVLREGAPEWHVGKPDADKLIRCVLDALTGIAYYDDSQVQIHASTKRYWPNPGVVIEVTYAAA